jgi:alpha-glucuronidase
MPENPDPRRPDWSALYYHRADAAGVGFDRTSRGSGAVDQYRSPLREQWSDPASCPESHLLWFHHVNWDHAMRSGRTLWAELVATYTQGAAEASDMEARWQALRGKVDDERHRAVAGRLHAQSTDAAAWRDQCLRYFGQLARASANP